MPELSLIKGLPAWSHFRSQDEKLPSFWSTNSHMSPRAGWLAGWLVDQGCGEGTNLQYHYTTVGRFPLNDQAEFTVGLPTTTACDAGSPISDKADGGTGPSSGLAELGKDLCALSFRVLRDGLWGDGRPCRPSGPCVSAGSIGDGLGPPVSG